MLLMNLARSLPSRRFGMQMDFYAFKVAKWPVSPRSEGSCQVVPVAERIFLPLRQRRQLWRCDEDGVLAAL